jgi:hypothetical protein
MVAKMRMSVMIDFIGKFLFIILIGLIVFTMDKMAKRIVVIESQTLIKDNANGICADNGFRKCHTTTTAR